jgi:NADP-dependent 3-hydroxy acid dehydrogenase YdfG
MTSFTINDSDLEAIKDQVVVITGGGLPYGVQCSWLTILGASSGIGLSTLRKLVSLGAKVYASDLNQLPEPENSQVPFMRADVASWKDQVKMFKAAKEKFGKIVCEP